MAEYIEREALLKYIEETVLFSGRPNTVSAEVRGARTVINRIKSAPVADVVEVRHGEWETTDVTQEWDKVQRFGHFHNDPNCKFFYSDEDPNGHDYCPNCGTKMDGKDGAK